jgi:hypothetical protein
MTTLNVSLPDALHKHAQDLATRNGVSLDQIFAMAIEKLTEGYLEERARRGSREGYEAALAQVPDVEPEDYDKLPEN